MKLFFSVDHVADKVIEKLSNSGCLNSQRKDADIFPLLKGIISQSNQNAEIPQEPSCSVSSISCSSNQPEEQMRNISSKILRLFLIDKQVEDLMLEKMKIYNELLSMKGVSSSLFNSWAQDQIQHGNVMNVISNTASTVPELTRVLQKDVNHEVVTDSNSVGKNNNIEEVLPTIQHECRTDPPETLNPPEPPDPVFFMPIEKCLEINKPKLSVRKDLIDPNVNRNLILNDFIPPAVQASHSVKSEKKKMKTKIQGESPVKKKKKEVFEFVNLIEDTTDEETIGVSNRVDDLGEDDIANEHRVKKNKIAMVYDLQGTIATRLTVSSFCLLFY